MFVCGLVWEEAVVCACLWGRYRHVGKRCGWLGWSVGWRSCEAGAVPGRGVSQVHRSMPGGVGCGGRVGMNGVWWDCGRDVWLNKWMADWGWRQ